MGYVFSAATFTAADYDDPQELVSPQNHSGESSLQRQSILMNAKNYIMHSIHNNLDLTQNFTETMDCKYQCIKWQSVGVKSLLSSVSVLLVGCATITKFTDLLSRNFGSKILGGEFVTEGTSATDMMKIIK